MGWQGWQASPQRGSTYTYAGAPGEPAGGLADNFGYSVPNRNRVVGPGGHEGLEGGQGQGQGPQEGPEFLREVPFVSESRLVPADPASLSGLLTSLGGGGGAVGAISANAMGERGVRALQPAGTLPAAVTGTGIGAGLGAGGVGYGGVLPTVDAERLRHARYMQQIAAEADRIEAALPPQSLAAYLAGAPHDLLSPLPLCTLSLQTNI